MKKNFGRFIPLLLLPTIFVLDSCKNQKLPVADDAFVLDTLTVKPEKKVEYKSSRTREIDIHHTKLHLSFNWDSAFVIGQAYITLTPYFYPVKEFTIDAKGFEILGVSESKGEVKKDLKYEYNGMQIRVEAGRELSAKDTFILFIDYVAKPEKLISGGSNAITDDRGLYFVNKDGKNPTKPRQLWTQGETEANSCWFPTVDSPNEKFTHEIYLTIEEEQVAISNGLRLFSVDNEDGTKTEYWKMDKAHSGYLVMLAIGEFSEYEDSWNDMQVNYYVDSAYLSHAKAIFGNTPEMLEFYSEYLGVPYPWQKYDQVVVHDFVSGAMENTTAVIHGEFLHQTKRELLDGNNENVIAHELFHHWFGDLVTCESWANLTLNEGFATYGEYLWEEYKHGRDMADFGATNDLLSYLRESKVKQEDLIRFDYSHREDMFDSHSYSKGGRVLHMLRNEIGEEAFRASLKYYLEKHTYQNVEVHDLRIAIEHITGRDMNWFFNQWFLASGHPELSVSYSYVDSLKKTALFVTQTQDAETTPDYLLPVDVIYFDNGKEVKGRYVIDKRTDTIWLSSSKEPDFVNFNAGGYLLAQLDVVQSNEAWKSQYRHSELAVDRREALVALKKSGFNKKDLGFYQEVMSDKTWYNQSYVIDFAKAWLKEEKNDTIREWLFEIVESNSSWQNRFLALQLLAKNYKDSTVIDLCLETMKDSSYKMNYIALNSLIDLDPERVPAIASDLKDSESSDIHRALSKYYGEHGTKTDQEYFEKRMSKGGGFEKYSLLKSYQKYLKRNGLEVSTAAIDLLEPESKDAGAWWIRMEAINAEIALHELLITAVEEESDAIEAMKDENPNKAEIAKSLEIHKADEGRIRSVFEEILKTETKPGLISVVRSHLEENSSSED